MRRRAVLAAVVTIAALVVGVAACSAGQRVDLGDESAGNLVAAIAGEPDQLTWTFQLRKGVDKFSAVTDVRASSSRHPTC
jgi:hypothetical protein